MCKNMARPSQRGLACLQTSRPIPQRSDENGAAIPLDGRRHQSPGLRRPRLGKRPSEHEVHKWWCDHAEWSLHKSLVDFAICIGFELTRSNIVRYGRSGSSAQLRDQHGHRLWRELDRSCEIRLQQCNRNSSQRWLGMSVPTYQGAVFCRANRRDQGCRSMGFGQTHGCDEFNFDARSRGQSISYSIVWRIFMSGLLFISTEGWV